MARADVSTYVVAPPAGLIHRTRATRGMPHVQSFWAARAPSAGPYAIPADGCADLVWAEGSSAPVVVGPTTEAAIIELEESRTYWGVRLVPGGLTALTCCPAERLVGLTLTAQELFGRVPAGEPRDCLQTLVSNPRRELHHVVTSLLGSAPRTSVRDFSRDVGWSERQVRRTVVMMTGIPPVRLLAIRQVHRAARAALGGASLARAAHDAAFADQAHFTREGRRVLGTPPRRYVRSVQAFAGTANYGRDSWTWDTSFTTSTTPPIPHASTSARSG